MRKQLFVFMVLLVLLALSSSVLANATNWFIKVSATNSDQMYGALDCTIGWYKNFSNGIDISEEIPLPPTPANGKLAYIAAVIPGTNIYSPRDLRANLWSDPSLPKSWSFVIFAQGDWNKADNIRVTFKPQPGPDGAFPVASLPPTAYVVFSGAYTATFTASEFAAKTNNWYFEIPSVDANNNLLSATNPVRFTMSIIPVPEPSSLLTLLCGFGGISGMLLRKKK